jgi:hypothetical protein
MLPPLNRRWNISWRSFRNWLIEARPRPVARRAVLDEWDGELACPPILFPL